MATNKSPWLRNDGGANKPLRLLIPAEVGSSYTFKRGEICKIGENTAGYAAPADAAGDVMLVVSDEEQKAADSARFVHCIVPRPDDLFEFELAAARAVIVGDCFAISDSQKLAFVADGSTNVMFRAAADDNCPLPEEKSVTRRSVSYVRGYFDEQASYFSELTGNS